MDDLISRQDAIEALIQEFYSNVDDYISERQAVHAIEKLPSAQPEQDREFIKLTVRNSNGRPYYSIIYLEFDDNGVGHDFEGYSSYSLDVISDYLKKYYMPSAQPERKKGKWINRSLNILYPEWERYTCSACGKHSYNYDFCPNCGSYNGGESDDKG